jgi:threonylcarbamoyladenosine tRNA methylthiotransferase MtaB
MATFSIENFGCRATEADAAALRGRLLASGLELVQEHARANVIVLNTCTVTAAADSEAREAVRKIRRANPGARIVLTGCYAQRAPEEVAALEGVALVVGNSHQTEIPDLLSQLTADSPPGQAAEAAFVPLTDLQNDAMSLARGPAKILTGDIFDQTDISIAPSEISRADRTRPILKIQDGCNNRCSYCVIPFVRGRSRSLPPDVVIAEIRKLVASGAKEIVLSGINLGSYGRDLEPRVALVSVVERILSETALDQMRFSSIEPQDVTEDFVALVATSTRIAPHFHVPLQSGSNRILRAMRRWYRSEHYAERVRVIHRYSPDAAIGADVIAGFPGETDQDFEDTCELLKRLPFTYLHVFSFSPRPGTEGWNLTEQVEPGIIRERSRRLRGIAQEKATSFRAAQAGRHTRALTLARGGTDWTEALTGNYLKVRVPGRWPANQWYQVYVDAPAPELGQSIAEQIPGSLAPSANSPE